MFTSQLCHLLILWDLEENEDNKTYLAGGAGGVDSVREHKWNAEYGIE